MIRAAVAALALTFAVASASAAKPTATAAPIYYKHMRLPKPRVGAIITPQFGLKWTDPRYFLPSASLEEQTAARTEALLEGLRPAGAPGRMDSVFVTTRPSLWTGLREPRFLAQLEPVDDQRVAVYDARHYETAFNKIAEALQTTNRRKKAQLFKDAEAAAGKYWTAPATGLRARPEILLGGGAKYLGPAPGAE